MATAEAIPVQGSMSAPEQQLEIIVNRKDLLVELEAAVSVVERKSTIPILANLLLEAPEIGGQVSISTSDLNQSVKTVVDAHMVSAGKVTIPARKLYEYVKLLTGDKVTIAQEKNHWINIKCGRSKTRMVGMASANFPVLPAVDVFPIALPAKILSELISKVMISISNEASRYTLNAALLIADGESLQMVSTDGHRLTIARHSCEEQRGPFKLPIPSAALKELASLIKTIGTQSVQMAEDSSRIFFRVGWRTLTTRKISGTFPQYEMVVPKIDSPGLLLDVESVSQSLNRCLLFSENDSRAVALTIEKEMLRVKAAAKDVGETEEQIEILGGPDEAISIGFNGEYIRDVLGLAQGSIQLQLQNNHSAVLFTYRTDEGLEMKHIIMPMQLGQK